MKIDWKTCIKVVVSAFILFLAVHYWEAFSKFVMIALGACAPLFIGAIIAYFVNILMSFYEKYYFPNSKKSSVIKSRRPVCLIGAIVTFIGVAYLIVQLIVPELISCITVLAKAIPIQINNLIKILEQNETLVEYIIPEDLLASLNNLDWQDLISKAVKIVTSGFSNILGTFASAVSTTISLVMTTLISCIFAIYLLLDKDKLMNQCNRLMKVYLKPSWNEKIHYVARILNSRFHGFIVGQCIEAFILGALCALGMMILKLPYAVMIGSFIGFTALIPVAGAYIGGAVGAFMILTVSPIKSVVFLVFLVLLQQFEENLIYPRVVGEAIDLSALWVLSAITIGGGVMGIPGMFIGVPLTATIYQIVKDDVKNKEKLKLKDVE